MTERLGIKKKNKENSAGKNMHSRILPSLE